MIKVHKKKEILNGNFGAPRVQGKTGQLDISKQTLNRSNLVIPKRDQAFQRLLEAYNSTDDLKLKETLWDMLKIRQAQVAPHKQQKVVHTEEFYWDKVKRERGE